jgi:uncharacterized protein (TIGR02145 family)
MTRKLFLSIILAVSSIFALSQGQTVNLTFSALYQDQRLQLDSVKIFWIFDIYGWIPDTLLIWPDTSIAFHVYPDLVYGFVGYSGDLPVGIRMKGDPGHEFRLGQNFPNPAKDKTTFSLNLPASGKVDFNVTDLYGRSLLNSSIHLEKGGHLFTFTPAGGPLLLLTATWKGIQQTIKVLSIGNRYGLGCRLEYAGAQSVEIFLKSLPVFDGITQESGLMDSPDFDTTYIFQFASNMPCPDQSTVFYEGQIYNTVQISSQCWLKENLNVGVAISKNDQSTDNGIIEKYCYDDQLDSCAKYGGLYDWNELMQYATEPGTRGICPPGWRIPTDNDWMILEAVADSVYGIGNDIWFFYQSGQYRGYNSGRNLKSMEGWVEGSGNVGTDLVGFSALPGGRLQYDWHGSRYEHILWNGYWSSSSKDENEDFNIGRLLRMQEDGILRIDYYYDDGGGQKSVRCVRGDIYNTDILLTFTATNNGTYVLLDSIKVANQYSGQPIMLYWPDTMLLLGEEFHYANQGLFCIGYANGEESALYHNPSTLQTVVFQFAVDIPCPGMPTITYASQVYPTVQIHNQCWLKRNLNVGTMINSANNQQNNGIIEKYCYNNNESNCIVYGGLYQWNEIINHDPYNNYQGICPPGWHIPREDDWKILEGTADSLYGIEDGIWGDFGYRGYDAGYNLKTASSWSNNGMGSDTLGFSAKPAGYRQFPQQPGFFNGLTDQAYFWGASSVRGLSTDSDAVSKDQNNYNYGYSLRCLRND